MTGYVGGRIRKIKVRNFMTYDRMELYPKRGLNLILGLNGSGKSSIMCAISLGLGGKPLFTGRAKHLSDVVKRGCQEAEIEIELESLHGPILICRKIKGDKCEWFLNRSVSNQTEVATVVKQFNIDTSNLCQFLPQEKVMDFSKLDKKQRLEHMLQAIGEPRLFELFNELKDLHQEFDELELDVKKCQIKKSSAEEENERISDEVQKQEGRTRLKKELDELLKQKKILDYKLVFEEVQQLKDKSKNQQRELAAVKEEEKEAITLNNSIFKSITKYSNQEKRLKSNQEGVINKISSGTSVLNNFKEKVENANIEYKNRLTEAETQMKKLHDINEQIEALKQALTEAHRKCKDNEEQDNKHSQELIQLQKDIGNLTIERETIKIEKNKYDYSISLLSKELSSLQNEHTKKMENLKRIDKFTYRAACWLLENRNRFKSHIYLPIMLEIKVHSSENCKYIENTIPFKDMIAFVCEDKSDCERFSEFLSQQELLVNVVMTPDTPVTNFSSPPLTSEYRNCGLQCYVSDLFTAPEAVMRYLSSCHKIHIIPVATSPIPVKKIEFVLQKYKTVFSENNRITGNRSKYGNNNWSVRKDFIVEQNLLSIHNDELQRKVVQKLQTLQEQKNTVTQCMEELESKLKDREKNQETLRQKKKYRQVLKKNILDLESRYQQKKRFLAQVSEIINVQEEKAKVTRKIQSINEHREETLRELDKLFKDFNSLKKELMKVILCMNSLAKSLKLAKASHEEILDKVKAAEVECETTVKTYREKKCFGRILLEEIQAMGEKYVKLIEASEITDLKTNFEDLEQKITHIHAQLNVNEDNEPLVTVYNNRKRKIGDYQTDIDSFNSQLEELKEKMETKKIEWLKPLQLHIGNINRRFSRYFKHLSCAGEISLDIPDNPNDFTKYGLQIKLKFHDDEPLTELSQTRHSGGECSVAAIVFILSLQELTEVPFRCIDEINQGMDSENERKIYQLIADSVDNHRCSQYFLLTPKLLMDVQYPDDVAVHIIFSSGFLNMKLDVAKHLEIARTT